METECRHLGDGGICMVALGGAFKVVVIDHDKPIGRDVRTVKRRDVCPFAGDPPDPKNVYCKNFED
jgi:hypothetical protein